MYQHPNGLPRHPMYTYVVFLDTPWNAIPILISTHGDTHGYLKEEAPAHLQS